MKKNIYKITTEENLNRCIKSKLNKFKFILIIFNDEKFDDHYSYKHLLNNMAKNYTTDLFIYVNNSQFTGKLKVHEVIDDVVIPKILIYLNGDICCDLDTNDKNEINEQYIELKNEFNKAKEEKKMNKIEEKNVLTNNLKKCLDNIHNNNNNNEIKEINVTPEKNTGNQVSREEIKEISDDNNEVRQCDQVSFEEIEESIKNEKINTFSNIEEDDNDDNKENESESEETTLSELNEEDSESSSSEA